MHHIVYTTHITTLMHHIVNTRKKSSRATVVAVVWVVGVGTTTFGCAIGLVPLLVTGVGCMENQHRLKNMKMKELKNSNDRKRTGAPRGDPK
jgi:hypothetical protein